MGQQRLRHTAEFKAQVAVAALREQITLYARAQARLGHDRLRLLSPQWPPAAG
jgi:hypothetical protein